MGLSLEKQMDMKGKTTDYQDTKKTSIRTLLCTGAYMIDGASPDCPKRSKLKSKVVYSSYTTKMFQQ